jgi:hypothetical protein
MAIVDENTQKKIVNAINSMTEWELDSLEKLINNQEWASVMIMCNITKQEFAELKNDNRKTRNVNTIVNKLLQLL